MLDDPGRIPEHDLSDPDPVRRAASVRSRRDLTETDMESALTDPAPEVRTAALWRLHVPMTPEQCERALCDPAPAVRTRAIFRPEPLSPRQIRRAFDDRNPLVAHAAAVRLRQRR